MKNFPQLKGKTFEVMGKKWRHSAADIVLSDVAWVAVTAGSASIVSIKAYTPNGAGLYLREPALLPTSVQQRGMSVLYIKSFLSDFFSWRLHYYALNLFFQDVVVCHIWGTSIVICIRGLVKRAPR